jgi:uncharacterized protein
MGRVPPFALTASRVFPDQEALRSVPSKNKAQVVVTGGERKSHYLFTRFPGRRIAFRADPTESQVPMNVRRMLLDVDKAVARPSLLEIGDAISACVGVAALNISLGDVDVETMGLEVTIEGTGLNYDEIVHAIEQTGAVVHGVEEIVAGDHILERVERAR